MATDLLNGMIAFIFQGNMIYLAPIIFLLSVLLFADRLIDLIYNSFSERRNSRY